MSEVVELLQEKIIKRILPIYQTLRDQGFTDNEIEKYLRDHHRKKTIDFYKNNNITNLRIVLSGIAGDIFKADSKIEKILYNLLKEKGVDFKFQYKIGFYRADYLLWGFLVLEIDGPQHELQKDHDKKRDSYLKKMGYQVLRIPTSVLIESTDEVLELILSFKPKEKTKKSKKKKEASHV